MEGVPEAPKRTFGFWTALAVAAATIAGGSCGAVSSAENADGYNVPYHLGLAWDRDSSAMGIVAFVIFAQSLLALVGVVRAGTGKTFGLACCSALVAFVVCVFVTPWALPSWRRLGCRLGAAEACLAASNDASEPEKSALEATACDRGVVHACVLVAAQHPEKRAALCEQQRVRCKGEPSWGIYCSGVEQLCEPDQEK